MVQVRYRSVVLVQVRLVKNGVAVMKGREAVVMAVVVMRIVIGRTGVSRK